MWRTCFPLISKSYGACEHSQPSNRGYTADRQRRFSRSSSHLYSYWLQQQDGQDRLGNSLRLKTLRLVCSHLNRAFETQVLSTLVILVTDNTLEQSLDMLRTFGSRSEETSKAVQHARTLKIEYLSPMLALPSEFFPIPQPCKPERRDSSPTPPSLIRRLVSAISPRRLKWVCSSSIFK